MHMHILCCKSGDDREFPNRTEKRNSVFFTDHNSVLTAAQFRPHLLWSFAGRQEKFPDAEVRKGSVRLGSGLWKSVRISWLSGVRR